LIVSARQTAGSASGVPGAIHFWVQTTPSRLPRRGEYSLEFLTRASAHDHNVAALWLSTLQRNQFANQRVVDLPSDPVLSFGGAEL
jgi:hypothetical protein